MTTKVKKLLWIIIVIISIGLSVGVYYWLFPSDNGPAVYTGPTQDLTVAVSELEATSLIRIASSNGYFQNQGLNVTITEQALGKFSLQEVFDGNAHIGTVAEVPIMKNAFSRNDFKVFSSIHESDLNIKILTHTNNGIESPQDLKGKIVGTTVGTVGEYFLSSFLLQNGLTIDDVSLVDASPEELEVLFKNREIHAISLREPHVYKLENLLGEEVQSFEQANIYNATFNLIALSTFIEENPEVIERFLTALLLAEEFIEDNQELAIAMISEDLELDEAYLIETWEHSSFQVGLDQSLITTMEHEARWAIESNSVPHENIPNYLDFIYLDALESIKSESITIIR